MAGQRPPSLRLRAYYGIDFPGKVAALVTQALLSFSAAATLFSRYAAAVALVRRLWPLLPAQIASFLVGFTASFALLLCLAYSLTLSANLRTSLLLRPRMARHMLSLVPAWQPVRTALDLGSGRGVLLASVGLQLQELGGVGRAIGFDSWDTKGGGGGVRGGGRKGSRIEMERNRRFEGAAAAADDAADANAAGDGGENGTADAGGSGSSGKSLRQRRADKGRAGQPARRAAAAAAGAAAGAGAGAGGASPPVQGQAPVPSTGLAAVSAPAVGSMAGALRAAAREGVGALVTCKTGAFDRLPFPDAYFDVVVSALRLHAIASVLDDTDPSAAERQRHKVLLEVARVLKPGGRVVIWDVLHVASYAECLRSLGWKHVVVTPGPNAFMLPTHVLSSRKPSK